MPAPRPPVRRTQAERRAHTRTALLDATIGLIAEVGYAAATNRRIAEKAGSSLGALDHHFPTRLDLIVAALDEVGQRVLAGLREQVTNLPTDPQRRLPAVLDAMWAVFDSELFTVWVKVWIAAADDRALYDRLVPVEARIGSAIATARDAVTPAKLSAAQWNRDFTVVMDTMRGLALRLRVEPRSPSGADPWPGTRTALLHLIDRR
ncbi:TetR/AcrR family transcriptional regulator [Nocardia vulneris]|uniref:TetR/AcrR family transcriptional regulator n=1 Tax=Nocardia vulneris TaxID=1141657 RepID=UPI0030D1F728